MTTLSALNERFAIKGQMEFKLMPNGLLLADVQNHFATAQIALQGAQVTHWAPRNQKQVIWLSPEARYVRGKSLRGGIPVCWPWFGSHPREPTLPGHGYARTLEWDVIDIEAMNDGRTRLLFRLPEHESMRHFWPHKAVLECSIIVGETLEIALRTRNMQDEALSLTEALHCYFEIGDISKVRLYGLEDTEYLDKVDGGQRKLQQGLVMIDGEVDRVYLGTRAECIIEDPVLRRNIHICKQGSNSTVVWNPWAEKASKLGDMGEDGYRHMLCVESGNAVEDVVSIASGESHQLGVSYRVVAKH